METAGAAKHLIAVFGATGDLFQRKLLPVLYRLAARGEFPAGSIVLGIARRPLDDESFRTLAVQSLKAEKSGTDEEIQKFCATTLFYHTLDDESPTGYDDLRKRIETTEQSHGLPGNRILYLALPLEAFTPTLEGIGHAGFNTGPGWTRVVVEKPFGRDLASAQALNQLLLKYFQEPQIFRIDHYLGKETVQNLLIFRFANMFVESAWNRAQVEKVEITVAEQLGVEGRAQYYDRSGALRDMVQNHVTQLLTLVAMEPPATKDEEAIRNEKVKVLESVVPLRPKDVVRGQYAAGTVDGQLVKAYREEPGVSPTSETETFIALRLKVDNWRWQGVPFFVRTGKRLPAKSTRVVLTFKAPPVSFFQAEGEYDANPDRISILIQPDEGFELAFEIKVPGREIRVQTNRMKFHYADVFGELPDGYETLLIDVMLGDPTLFVRADEVEESWRLYAPLLAHPPPIVFYPANTWGPPEAQALIQQWGHMWSPS
ncbi:MAG: glucose-6-phosphate dehydrogenase [Thermoplasmata archaeon]|jgi:glucose-6-phosphate 1-dehydrogenase